MFNQIITLVRQLNSSGSLCQVSGVRCQVSRILGYQATGGNISIQDHQQSSTTELKAVAHCNAAAHLLSITQHGAIK